MGHYLLDWHLGMYFFLRFSCDCFASLTENVVIILDQLDSDYSTRVIAEIFFPRGCWSKSHLRLDHI